MVSQAFCDLPFLHFYMFLIFVFIFIHFNSIFHYPSVSFLLDSSLSSSPHYKTGPPKRSNALSRIYRSSTYKRLRFLCFFRIRHPHVIQFNHGDQNIVIIRISMLSSPCCRPCRVSCSLFDEIGRASCRERVLNLV